MEIRYRALNIFQNWDASLHFMLLLSYAMVVQEQVSSLCELRMVQEGALYCTAHQSDVYKMPSPLCHANVCGFSHYVCVSSSPLLYLLTAQKEKGTALFSSRKEGCKGIMVSKHRG